MQKEEKILLICFWSGFLIAITSITCHWLFSPKTYFYQVTYKTEEGIWRTFRTKPKELDYSKLCRELQDDTLRLLKVGYKELWIDQQYCGTN